MSASLPAPLDAALAALADLYARAGIGWVVAGSTARALQGFAVTPRDLDVEVAAGAAPVAAGLLGLTARLDHGAHATSVRAAGRWCDVDVDVSGGLEVRGPGGRLRADMALALVAAARLPVGGAHVHAIAPEEQIARAVVTGAARRLDRIAAEWPRDRQLDATYLSLRLAAASAAR